MPLTQVRGGQVQDGSIQRVDLDVATAGQAVIRKVIAGNGISIGYDGVDSGTGDVTVNMAAIAASSILGNATGAPQPPVAITNWSNPAWLSSLAWSKITGVPSFEPALGNPAVNGYILSSTTAGARSWIPAPSGGGTITLTGDITGSGTSSIATQIAAGVVGSNEINNTVNLLMTAQQSIKVTDASTSGIFNALQLGHNSSGTPVANFGTGIQMMAASDTVVDRTLGGFVGQWSNPTDASRTSWLAMRPVSSGIQTTTGWMVYGSGGASMNQALDPGAGYINALKGFKVSGVDILGAGAQVDGAAVTTAGTVSTSGVMAGLNTIINPNTSGRLLIVVNGSILSSVAGQFGSVVSVRYGTGTAPAHGAAPTGTICSTGSATGHSASANYRLPFSMVAIVTGLTPGTNYWIDVAYGSSSATSTVKLEGASVAAIEF